MAGNSERSAPIPPRYSVTTQHALTLIELLVVVAIIAILVSILLPSLNRARSQTHSAACQSNQRQILQAMQFYAADHDDRWYTFNHRFDFEQGVYTGITYADGVPVRWQEIADGNSAVALAMRPGSYRPARASLPATAEPSVYLPNWNILSCPATANRITRPEHLNDIVASRRTASDDERQAGHSYAFLNGFETGAFLPKYKPSLGTEGQYDVCPHDGLPDCLKSPRTIVNRIAKVILLADGDNRVNPDSTEPDLANCPDNAADNHGAAGWNVGFADGHVAWLDRTETFWALYASDMHGHWTPGQSNPDTIPETREFPPSGPIGG